MIDKIKCPKCGNDEMNKKLHVIGKYFIGDECAVKEFACDNCKIWFKCIYLPAKYEVFRDNSNKDFHMSNKPVKKEEKK